MFSSIKLWIAIGGIGVIVALGFAAYKFYDSQRDTIERLQKDNAILSENNIKLDNAVKSRDEAIRKLNEFNDRQNALNSELAKSTQLSESKLAEIRERIANQDLQGISLDELLLIVNGEINEIFDSIERDTSR